MVSMVDHAHLEELAAATRRLVRTVDGMPDAAYAEPSLLPDWNRGHVVTHLARNADALVNLLHWAQSGVPTPMYSSPEQRDAEIEAGAARTAVQLRADASASCGRFLQAVNELHANRFDTLVTRLPGAGASFPVSKVPGMRRLEVEVHHADLDLGYSAHDWPADFTAHLLPRRRRELGPRPMTWRLSDTDETIVLAAGGPEVVGHSADLAWWLIGRGTGEGLVCSAGTLPDLGRWL